MIYKISENYAVRTLKKSDLDDSYRLWFQDQKICQFNSHGKFNLSEESIISYFNSAHQGNTCILWGIFWFPEGIPSYEKLKRGNYKEEHIGNLCLQNISLINRNAEFAIIFGDWQHHNKGIALNASRYLLAHGFYKINLERIYCGTAETNQAMVKLAKRLCMKEEGRRKKHLFLEGAYVDMLEFGVLREEYDFDYTLLS